MIKSSVRALAILGALFSPSMGHTQTSEGQSAAEPPVAVVVPPAPPASHPNALLVEADTMVRLMVVNEVSTRTTKPGDRFLLRVDENVVVNGVTVIPVGTKAWGEVLSAEASRALGRAGKLSARLLYVEAGEDRIPLAGDSKTAGANGAAETVMGVIGLGPFGLFVRGNNAKLKAGDIFNGYFERDMLFDPATSRLFAAPASAAPAVAPVAQ